MIHAAPVVWEAAKALFPSFWNTRMTSEQQKVQHQYTLVQGDRQRDRQMDEQFYINELRKDFNAFETNLQRESEAIRFGRQIQLQIEADLARRFIDDSPFMDSLEDLRRQLFRIYADEQKR
jgi:hypothetical protein